MIRTERGALAARLITHRLIVLLVLLTPAAAHAQDAHVQMLADSVEWRLARDTFMILDHRPSRGMQGERTARTALQYPDGTMMVAKWAAAPRGGEEFNNSPRFELAAYQLQKLFLSEAEYVVPPTVIRAFPLAWHRELQPRTPATFRGTEAVLVVLQYWLFNVTGDDFWDPDRFATDTAYARHLGNFNIFTYLVRHSDENEGNYLISRTPGTPRIFSVDNGVSFSSLQSDRGHSWRRLRVDRLPAATIDRLRALTPADLTRQLETLAEFRVLPDGGLEAVEPTASLSPGRAIRRRGDRIQLGLTQREIAGVQDRMERLLRQVDNGEIEVFQWK